MSGTARAEALAGGPPTIIMGATRTRKNGA